MCTALNLDDHSWIKKFFCVWKLCLYLFLSHPHRKDKIQTLDLIFQNTKRSKLCGSVRRKNGSCRNNDTLNLWRNNAIWIILQEVAGLQSDKKIVVNFMLKLSKKVLDELKKWFLSNMCSFYIKKWFSSIVRNANQWFTSNWKY